MQVNSYYLYSIKQQSTMQTSITVKEKSVYGRTLVYPACAQAENIAKLLNVKTFNDPELRQLAVIGFDINLIKLPA